MDKKKLIKKIEKIIKEPVIKKINKYSPETQYMPFQKAIVGEKYRAIFSFVHSMSTTFGMSIWEQISVTIAKARGFEAISQYDIQGSISDNTDNKINKFLTEMRLKNIKPDTKKINLEIKKFAKNGALKFENDKDKRVDVFIRDNNNNIYFIDITSVKPNMKEFSAMKLKLMRWTAIGYAFYKAKNVYSLMCMPYNPYYPNQYDRFSGDPTCDYKNDLLVGEEYWNTIAGYKIYNKLISSFEKIGKASRKDLEKAISKFTNL